MWHHTQTVFFFVLSWMLQGAEPHLSSLIRIYCSPTYILTSVSQKRNVCRKLKKKFLSIDFKFWFSIQHLSLHLPFVNLEIAAAISIKDIFLYMLSKNKYEPTSSLADLLGCRNYLMLLIDECYRTLLIKLINNTFAGRLHVIWSNSFTYFPSGVHMRV